MPFVKPELVKNRRIGSMNVFPIGFGTMGLSIAYGTPSTDDEERLKFLDAVYASGVNHWDTADIYGDSEDLLGKWFRRSGKRLEIFLATKFGFKDGGMSLDASPESARESILSSLKRLGLDYIDLYYIHRPDKKHPIEHTMTALKDLVKEGKIRYIGISECSAATLRRAHAVHPIEAMQIEYSPFCLDAEGVGVIAAARELGVKIVAYSPLGRGMLTGRYKSPDDFGENDFRRYTPKFSAENFPHILALVKKLGEIGAKHDATSGQVTLAWLLAQGTDILPIPGTSKLENLKENIAAAALELDADEVAQIREMSEQAATSFVGDRYPGALADMLFVDTPALE